MYVIGSHWIPCVAVWTLGFFNVNCKWQLAVGHRPPPIGHSRLLAVMNNPPGLNYGPKKSDWLNFPLPLKSYWLKPQWRKTLLVEISTTAWPSFNTQIEILMFPIRNVFLTLWTYNQSINQANKQANNFSLQASSLREREQVALVWGLAQLFLVEIVPLNYQQIIYFKWICYSRSSQPYPLLAALLREDDDHTYHTLHTDPRTREKRMHI